MTAGVAGGPVTYPQMVGYVSRREDSTRRQIRELRSELLAGFADVRGDLERHTAALDERMNAHDAWHRDQLTGLLASHRVAAWNLLMALIALASVVVAIVATVR